MSPSGPENSSGHATAEAKPPDWYCGADLGEGRRCRRRAGHGTDHLGIGTCKYHLGSTTNHRRHAALERGRRQAVVLSEMRDRVVDPHEALLEEVHRTAGMVSFLGAYLAGGSSEDLTQIDVTGKFERPSVWYELYERERKHLVEAARACIAAGVEERQVRLAEDQAALLGDVVRGVIGGALAALRDAGVAPGILATLERDVLPAVVRRELLAAAAIDASIAAAAIDASSAPAETSD